MAVCLPDAGLRFLERQLRQCWGPLGRLQARKKDALSAKRETVRTLTNGAMDSDVTPHTPCQVLAKALCSYPG